MLPAKLCFVIMEVWKYFCHNGGMEILMNNDGKEKILQAAQRVIIKFGINGATMRGIAKEAGLSTGAIYHYYRTKEEVLYDIMDKSLSESTRITEKSKGKREEPDIIISEISENILKRFKKISENRLQLYLSHEAMVGNEVLELKFREKYKEWITRTEELIKILYQREDNKYNRAFASLLIGAIDGVVLQLMLGANVATPEEIAEVYSFILKEGIPRFLDYLNNEIK